MSRKVLIIGADDNIEWSTDTRPMAVGAFARCHFDQFDAD